MVKLTFNLIVIDLPCIALNVGREGEWIKEMCFKTEFRPS